MFWRYWDIQLFPNAIEERQISLIKWTGEPDKVMNAAGNYIKVQPKTPAATFNNNETCIKARKEIGGKNHARINHQLIDKQP